MTTLDEAQQYVRDNLAEGVSCPCCSQLAKEYRRKINSDMALDLIALYRQAWLVEGIADAWMHVPTVLAKTRRRSSLGYSKLRYWGLLVEQTAQREDGGRAGFWRLTFDGRCFVRHSLVVPTYAVIYDGRLKRLEGPRVSISDALGSKFNYSELMEGL